jgi:hypothetical protein
LGGETAAGDRGAINNSDDREAVDERGDREAVIAVAIHYLETVRLLRLAGAPGERGAIE